MRIKRKVFLLALLVSVPSFGVERQLARRTSISIARSKLYADLSPAAKRSAIHTLGSIQELKKRSDSELRKIYNNVPTEFLMKSILEADSRDRKRQETLLKKVESCPVDLLFAAENWSNLAYSNTDPLMWGFLAKQWHSLDECLRKDPVYKDLLVPPKGRFNESEQNSSDEVPDSHAK